MRASPSTQDASSAILGADDGYPEAEEEAIRGRIIEEEDDSEGSEYDLVDPDRMTIKEIKELSGEMNAAQWARMLELERAGKQRASAIAFMKAAISNLSG
jgi:hypothetical protein